MMPRHFLNVSLACLLLTTTSFARDVPTAITSSDTPRGHFEKRSSSAVLTSQERAYVAQWRVQDPSWWRSPERNREAMTRMNRILNMAHSAILPLTDLHRHPELFGISHHRTSSEPNDLGWLRIDHRERPDLLVFEKMVIQHLSDTYGTLLEQSRRKGAPPIWQLADATATSAWPWFRDERGRLPSQEVRRQFFQAMRHRLFTEKHMQHTQGGAALADIHDRLMRCGEDPRACFSLLMWDKIERNFSQQQKRVQGFLAAIDPALSQRMVAYLIEEPYRGLIQTFVPISDQRASQFYFNAYKRGGGSSPLAQRVDFDPGHYVTTHFRPSLQMHLATHSRPGDTSGSTPFHASEAHAETDMVDLLLRRQWKTVVDYGLPDHHIAHFLVLKCQGFDMQFGFQASLKSDNRTATLRRVEGNQRYHPPFIHLGTLVDGSTINHPQTLTAMVEGREIPYGSRLQFTVSPSMSAYKQTHEQQKPLMTMGHVWYERLKTKVAGPQTLSCSLAVSGGNSRDFLVPLFETKADRLSDLPPILETIVKSKGFPQNDL